ncbi:ABC transporter permease [Pyxidicoccus xibeiensis]|uniref:ABC transporter permease n=1 Tax=Pyxidicoccus xibeiensis TaxID=2906759 RepID=UPI0020A80CD3|nr:DUF3526 domain-containing protein [Pyxidicoccus xibeiensis]MCP3142751.1 DUF3526 domain-containing protein [Pyxidicoccus xibeiensis]
MSLLRHEWRLLRADRMLALTTTFLLLLVALGLFNGWRFTRTLQAHQQSLIAQETERRAQLALQAEELRQGKGQEVPAWKSPAMPVPVGSRLVQPQALLPPGPLGALVIGQLDLLPTVYQVSLQGRVTDFARDTLEHPTHLATGPLDLAFVLLYLLPLFALALSFDLVSREREDGTLRLVLVQAAGLRGWALRRLAVRAGVLLGLCVLAGLAGHVLTGGPGGTGRLLGWVVLVVAYGAFWFALALAVNALGLGSSTNALVLLGAWVLLVVVVPAVAQLGVSRMYPVPSRVALVGATRTASLEAEKRGSEVLSAYLQDHPELAPEGTRTEGYWPTALAVQDEAARATAPVVAAFQAQLARQQATLGVLRFASPALAFQQALQDVAGTGSRRHEHFLAQVDRFHTAWREALLPRVFAASPLGAAEHRALPRFAYEEQPGSDVVAQVALGLLALLLPTLLALGLGLSWLGRPRIS